QQRQHEGRSDMRLHDFASNPSSSFFQPSYGIGSVLTPLTMKVGVALTLYRFIPSCQLASTVARFFGSAAQLSTFSRVMPAWAPIRLKPSMMSSRVSCPLLSKSLIQLVWLPNRRSRKEKY